MTEETFEYLLKTTPPEELRRQMKEVHRWFKWRLWANRHPHLAAILEAGREIGLAMLIGRGMME